MPIPSGQNCGGCAFMDFAGPYAFYGREVLTTDGVQLGYCRKNPPLPAIPSAPLGPPGYGPKRKTYVLGVEWPEVRADDWCGDWQA